MSKQLPVALEKLIADFRNLPGVGPRTAERYAYYLLREDPAKSAALADSTLNLHRSVGLCQATYAYVEAGQKFSALYSDPARDKTQVAVVAEQFDIIALENTNSYKGTYHVLGGLISPIDNVGPENLRFKQLVKRISSDKVKEVILAFNASIEGETTSLYLQKLLEGNKLKITRLARGLPIGVDLEYADQITLSRALEGRQIL